MDNSSETLHRDISKEDRKMLKKCNLCDFSSGQAGYLRTHMKIHYGEKSYKCEHCDFASVWADNLKNHLKTHFGETSYKCGQCDFSTVHARSLWAHMKTHCRKIL